MDVKRWWYVLFWLKLWMMRAVLKFPFLIGKYFIIKLTFIVDVKANNQFITFSKKKTVLVRTLPKGNDQHWLLPSNPASSSKIKFRTWHTCSCLCSSRDRWGGFLFLFKIVEPFVPCRAFFHVSLSTRVLQTTFPGHLFERFALDGYILNLESSKASF